MTDSTNGILPELWSSLDSFKVDFEAVTRVSLNFSIFPFCCGLWGIENKCIIPLKSQKLLK